ncbi:hypothetical protein [Vitiosangium sp. GDMCC 1.1324]|uniref:hypothetical protein n=1 Tax=Vitiosangium sp. (strain GDMCC 1.1324) TaxID=2138576 RepID=UPI000D35189D|nr:hypothetical protein [Vitiosangium sp. GDMCC 1.1324]PTL83179.1 hypothetical protein DAT35_14335 [Vitiosangium sp. GDMCC 1.1324]
MLDIVPNLIPVVIAFTVWGASLEGSPAVARGARFALIVTSVMAIPPVALAASVGFKSLGMMFMLTLLLAVASAGAGLVAYFLGYKTAERAR